MSDNDYKNKISTLFEIIEDNYKSNESSVIETVVEAIKQLENIAINNNDLLLINNLIKISFEITEEVYKHNNMDINIFKECASIIMLFHDRFENSEPLLDFTGLIFEICKNNNNENFINLCLEIIELISEYISKNEEKIKHNSPEFLKFFENEYNNLLVKLSEKNEIIENKEKEIENKHKKEKEEIEFKKPKKEKDKNIKSEDGKIKNNKISMEDIKKFKEMHKMYKIYKRIKKGDFTDTDFEKLKEFEIGLEELINIFSDINEEKIEKK